MRLKPGLTSEQAYAQLSVAATMTWGLAEAAGLESTLRSIAEAMAAIGSWDVPDDTEPLFGGDDELELGEA